MTGTGPPVEGYFDQTWPEITRIAIRLDGRGSSFKFQLDFHFDSDPENRSNRPLLAGERIHAHINSKTLVAAVTCVGNTSQGGTRL